MEKTMNPAGTIDLKELDELTYTAGGATTSPICATILVTIITVEATATAFTITVCG